jgi:prophage regulatory protein
MSKPIPSTPIPAMAYPQDIKLPQLTDCFIRKPTVLKATDLGDSTLFHLIRKGIFPKPYKLSARISAWKLSEVQAWIDSRKPAQYVVDETGYEL